MTHGGFHEDPLYSWLPDTPTFGLTKFERTMLTLTGGLALDYATHSAALKYAGMPARTLAAYTIGIAGTAYLSGMVVSNLIDSEEGVENYRYAVNKIMTDPGGFQDVVDDSILMIALHIEKETREARHVLWHQIPMKHWVPYM